MTIPLINNAGDSESRYLVFTSAGDNNNIHKWLKGHRNFDIWVSYYGNTTFNCAKQVEFYLAKKGGKFPNLQYVYERWRKQLENYQAIFVMDDDIVISGTCISRLFDIREKYDLWLLQPAFDPRGKISHPITEVKPFSFMRYTNFVENGCALFRKDKLDDFMKVFEPSLVGYGTDFWFLDLLAPNIKGKVAIVDEIACINPRDVTKSGHREIELLQDTPTRIKHWKTIQKQHNIKIRKPTEFSSIKSPLGMFNTFKGISVWLIQFACKWGRAIKKIIRRAF